MPKQKATDENIIQLSDIFDEYNFKTLFPEKHAQYIRNFHEFLRRGETAGTVPKRKEGCKRWEWDAGENLDEVHRLIKERYPEVEGKETEPRREITRKREPRLKQPRSAETRSNRTTPRTASLPATPCVSNPAVSPPAPAAAGTPKEPEAESSRTTVSEARKQDDDVAPAARTPGSNTEQNAVSPSNNAAATRNKLSIPKARGRGRPAGSTKRARPVLPEKDMWFPLDPAEVIKELVCIGQSVRSIAYACDMDPDEVRSLIEEANPTVMGIIPDL